METEDLNQLRSSEKNRQTVDRRAPEEKSRIASGAPVRIETRLDVLGLLFQESA